MITSVHNSSQPSVDSFSLIHILLDTNSLWNAFFGNVSISLKTLSNLAEQKKIVLHISDVALREIRTQVPTSVSACGVSDAKRCIKELDKLTPHTLKTGLIEIRRLLDQHTLQLETSVTQEIDDWLKQANVFIHPVDSEHTNKVLEAYFGGGYPFKTIKSREDFPDAFIWQVFQDLAIQYENVHFLCHDDKMAKSASSVIGPGNVHASINDLLRSGCLPITATQLDLAFAKRCSSLLSELENTARHSFYTDLDSYAFKLDENILPDAKDNEIRIEQVPSVGNLQIERSSIVPTGGGNVLAKFSATLTARASHSSISNSGLPGTFNILKLPRVLAEYGLELVGSLLFKSASLSDDVQISTLEATEIQTEIANAEIHSCKPRSWSEDDVNEIDERDASLFLNCPDRKDLEIALDTCQGIILVTGQSRFRRRGAAMSLLLESARRNPGKFYLTAYRQISLLRAGCVAFPNASGSLMSRQEHPVEDTEIYTKIESTEPDGVLIDVSGMLGFRTALGLCVRFGLLIIGVTDAETVEQCLDNMQPGVIEPLAIVEAS